MVDSTTSALIAAIRGYGDDPAKLAEHSENALALVDREFSMRGIVARLLARYESGYEKVEWLDAAFAGSHVLVAAGPYDLPTADVVVDDLQRFAAGETGRRLRFTPVPMTRKWRRNPDAQVNVVASVPAEHESRWAAAQVGDQRLAVFSGFAAGLGSMPVTILLDGQYAYLRLDHGLGDACWTTGFWRRWVRIPVRIGAPGPCRNRANAGERGCRPPGRFAGFAAADGTPGLRVTGTCRGCGADAPNGWAGYVAGGAGATPSSTERCR